jgi:hypothetical protein
MGPIAALAALPLRVHPWVIADMLDKSKAAAYLNMDFVEKQLHLRSPVSNWISNVISRISVPLLRSAGCVAVGQGEALLRTYQESVDLLSQGGYLLVFPEDPHRAWNEQYQMAPFQKGFARLGELFYQQTGECLDFFPLVIHIDSLRIKIGKPIRFNPASVLRNECVRIADVLEAMIHEMYIGMAMNNYLGVPLPH